MNDILQDLSAASLTAAIEDNLFDLMRSFRLWPRAEFHEEAALIWCITDIPFPLFNGLVRARIEPQDLDVTIQSVLSEAERRGVPLLWWTGPQTSPPDLGTRLKMHGFSGEENTPGMAVELAQLKPDVPVPPGFHVRQVTDQATLKLLCQVCIDGFEMPAWVADPLCDCLSHIEPDVMQAYLGWLDDKPVATSVQFLAAGVAGIYNVATIPAARRQGIGAAMTVAPLREASRLGYRVGILHASEMGQGVYRWLGFQEYCKIGQYIWMGAHAEQAAG